MEESGIRLWHPSSADHLGPLICSVGWEFRDINVYRFADDGFPIQTEHTPDGSDGSGPASAPASSPIEDDSGCVSYWRRVPTTTKNVRCVAIPCESDSGPFVVAVSGYDGGRVCLYQPHATDEPHTPDEGSDCLRLVLDCKHTGYIYGLDYMRLPQREDAPLVVVSSYSNQDICLSNPTTGEVVAKLQSNNGECEDTQNMKVINPEADGGSWTGGDGRVVVSLLKTIERLDETKGGKCVAVYESAAAADDDGSDAIEGLELCPKNDLMISTSSGGHSMIFWSLKNPKDFHKVHLDGHTVQVAYSKEANLAFCGVKKTGIEVWDPRNLSKRVLGFNPHSSPTGNIPALASLGGDGTRFASLSCGSGTKPSLACWDVKGKVLGRCKRGESGYANGMCFTGPDGQQGQQSAVEEAERMTFLSVEGHDYVRDSEASIQCLVGTPLCVPLCFLV